MNAPTKRQRLAEWIQKQDSYICCLQETHLKTGDTYRLKVKGWKKILHANRDQKKAGVAILISDKIDFKTKAVKRDKDGHYIMIKGSIQEEDITIINIFHTKGDQRKAGVAGLISDKIDIEIKAMKRNKEGHYIIIKGSIQEDITIINIHAPT